MKPARDLVRSAQITRWKARQQAEAAAAARQRRMEREEPTLALEGLQPLRLCPGCYGRGCGQCAQKGVIAGTVPTVECRRCYGVGSLAAMNGEGFFKKFVCPDCGGQGEVPVEAQKGD